MATCVAAPCKTIVSYIVTGIAGQGSRSADADRVSGQASLRVVDRSSSGSSSGSTAPATVPRPGSTSRHVARRTGRAPPRRRQPHTAARLLDECSIMSRQPAPAGRGADQAGGACTSRWSTSTSSPRRGRLHRLHAGQLRALRPGAGQPALRHPQSSTIHPIMPRAYRDELGQATRTRLTTCCGGGVPTGWPSRARASATTGSSRRRVDGEGDDDEIGTDRRGWGHPERGAIASARGLVGFSISRLPRILSAPVDPGSLVRSSGEFGRGRWSSSAPGVHRDCGWPGCGTR